MGRDEKAGVTRLVDNEKQIQTMSVTVCEVEEIREIGLEFPGGG